MCLCLPSTWHMQTPQIQAAAMCCGRLRHARPGQGLDRIQTDLDVVHFSHDNSVSLWNSALEYNAFKSVVVLSFSSYQGEGRWRAGGWHWQQRLRKPHQTDQVWHQTGQGTWCNVCNYEIILGRSLNTLMNLNVFCCFFSVEPCQMFKGPSQDIDAIYTASSSTVCGVTLETNGNEYLITGTVGPHY